MSTYDDALIERAARALYARDPKNTTPWDSLPPFMRNAFTSDARAVLDAVADELHAKAWDEGFDACFDVDGGLIKQNVPNPYREGA